MIDDAKDESSVAQSLRNLLKLSKILKRRRIDSGALVLASSEIRFVKAGILTEVLDSSQTSLVLLKG
jgi:exoribonuclease R